MEENEGVMSGVMEISDKLISDVIEWRRHLHQNPELSYEEEKTAAFIAQILQKHGIPFSTNIGGHGVVATIQGGLSKGDLIALRADMDALPIQETNDCSYASTVEGVMHACGHDVHTANLLGVAIALHSNRAVLNRDIRIIFQPGEEKLPGGATFMIADGVLENPRPRVILGFHVFPQLQVGHVGMRAGNYMASADELYISIKGKGGHAAVPQDCIDPIFIAAQWISQIQSLISRRSDPTIPSVLTLGKINSIGGATNIIPDEVRIEGTFRTMDESWRSRAHELIIQLSDHIGQAHGATIDARIDKGYPVLFNDPDLTEAAFKIAIDLMDEDHVHELPIRLTSEDFAFYSHEIPACFIRIGTSNSSKGIGASLHTSKFDIDEEAFRISIPLMLELASRL